MSRTAVGVFLKRAHAPEDVTRALADELGVAQAEVGPLEADDDVAVRFERVDHALGFAVQLDLYVDPARAKATTGSALAAGIARRLDDEVAYSDGSQDPYSWVVVDASGRVELRSQSTSDDEGLVLEEVS